MRKPPAPRFAPYYHPYVALRPHNAKGAGELAKYLEGTYGRDSMAMIVDEGGPQHAETTLVNVLMHHPGGFAESYGNVVFAAPSVTGMSKSELSSWLLKLHTSIEKGYLDVKIQVEVPGGHSSVPPRHTVHKFLTFLA